MLDTRAVDRHRHDRRRDRGRRVELDVGPVVDDDDRLVDAGHQRRVGLVRARAVQLDVVGATGVAGVISAKQPSGMRLSTESAGVGGRRSGLRTRTERAGAGASSRHRLVDEVGEVELDREAEVRRERRVRALLGDRRVAALEQRSAERQRRVRQRVERQADEDRRQRADPAVAVLGAERAAVRRDADLEGERARQIARAVPPLRIVDRVRREVDLHAEVEQPERLVGPEHAGVARDRRDVAEQPRVRLAVGARVEHRGRGQRDELLVAREQLVAGALPRGVLLRELVELLGQRLERAGVDVLAHQPLAEVAAHGIARLLGLGRREALRVARHAGRDEVDEVREPAQLRGRGGEVRLVLGGPAVAAERGDAIAERRQRRPVLVDAHAALPELDQIVERDRVGHRERVGRRGQHARAVAGRVPSTRRRGSSGRRRAPAARGPRAGHRSCRARRSCRAPAAAAPPSARASSRPPARTGRSRSRPTPSRRRGVSTAVLSCQRSLR